MRLRRIFAAALFLAPAFAALPAMADSYKVSFRHGRPAFSDGADAGRSEYRIADVEARLTPDHERIGLMRAGADTGLLNGWATFIYRPRAKDAAGADLSLTYEGGGSWRVGGWRRGEITVAYSMLLQHDRFPNEPGDNELAYARPYGVMWTGRALFMEGAPSQDIAVDFDLPEGWRVTSLWRAAPDAPARFIARDTDDLLDSGFFAGTHIERIVTVAGGQARLALGRGAEGGEAAITGTLETFLPAYEQLFSDGISDDFLVIASEADFWGAGVMGRTISMSLGGPLEGPFAGMAAYIIAHEGFHLWNTDHRWRLANPNGELEWLKEGFSEYYTFLTGVRAGAFDEAFLIEQLGERAGLYLTALRQHTIAEGGKTKHSGGDASYNLVYSGGMMLAAALDAKIRAHSNGAQSLDDVLRKVHATYSGEGSARLSYRTLQMLLPKYGIERGFLDKYVKTQSPLPLKELFAGFGLTISIDESGEAVEVSIDKAADAGADEIAAWNALIGAGSQ